MRARQGGSRHRNVPITATVRHHDSVKVSRVAGLARAECPSMGPGCLRGLSKPVRTARRSVRSHPDPKDRVPTEIGATMRVSHTSRPAVRGCTPTKLHVIDIENMVGGLVSPDRCSKIWAEYETKVGVSKGDQITVAVAWPNAEAAFFAVPARARRIGVPTAPDTADRALCESVEVSRVALRHHEVVIASGDHFFAPLARALRDAGVRVVQVVTKGVGVSAESTLR